MFPYNTKVELSNKESQCHWFVKHKGWLETVQTNAKGMFKHTHTHMFIQKLHLNALNVFEMISS